jgi:hypothetical protein
LATASAGLLVLAALPVILSGALVFRRWYRGMVGVAGGLLIVGALLGTSPQGAWVVAALAVLLAGGLVWQAGRSRAQRTMEDEALEFLHSFVAVMGVEKGLEEALRHVARDPAFSAAHPRMTETVRHLVAEVEGGKRLRRVLTAFRERPDASGPVWRQMTTLAGVLEDGEGRRITVEEQRDALEVAWRVLYRVRNINRALRQDMASMEMAKWVFTIILPGMNLFMARMIHDYRAVFLDTLVGQIVLGFEVAALAAIFLIFSRLQRLPEVKL